SQAHRLYYAKGFVRRLERETAFVSEHDERLLALTYRVPDPLPPDQVIHVDRLPRPEGSPPFGRRPDKSAWPQRPAGQVDAAGAFLPDRAAPDEALARARQTAERFAAAHVLARSAGDDADLIETILDDLWAGAQTVLWSPDPEAGDAALRVFFARLDTLDRRLARRGPFLHGTRPGRADAYLFSVLLAYDLSWRAGFPAQGAVADWPHLWRLVRLAVPKAALTHAERQAAGVEPWGDGTFHQPFGPLPPIPGLEDVRAEWLASPTTLRRRRPPLDPTVPATPHSGDWPAAPSPLRARIDALAHHVRERAGAGDPAVDRLTAVVVTDLVRPLRRLAHGSVAEDQIIARRLFWARLGWFEARLKGRDHVAGAEPTAADAALDSVLREFDAGLVGALAPIDPVLADFPRLAARLADCPGR
ncbi:MAG: hypothetical protein LBS56_06140, partial [Propionibacteriaceae bacterium]|nr:hypothetical protein [Propionibacteriaceae bacterium]